MAATTRRVAEAEHAPILGDGVDLAVRPAAGRVEVDRALGRRPGESLQASVGGESAADHQAVGADAAGKTVTSVDGIELDQSALQGPDERASHSTSIGPVSDHDAV